MTVAQLRVNRAVWLAREKVNYRKWFFARYKSTLPQPARLANRKKFWGKYAEAHNKRVWYDQQIAQKTKGAAATEVSTRGVDFIKHFEGYIGHIYHDSVGVPTVGYGHTENVHPGAVWVRGQKRAGFLTEPEASELLKQDLNKHYAPYVRNLGVHLNQNQFDALVSFVYNVGPGGISSSTHIGRDLRAGDYRAAANDLLAWDRAGGNVLQGLLNRREAERNLFLS